MKLHDLKPTPGSTRKPTRVGRGTAAGQGNYGGRGRKGQSARGVRGKRAYFEGGQLPLVRRLPFKRGFTNLFRVPFQEVNLEDLNARFDGGAVVDPEALAKAGLIRSADKPVVVLGRGELDKALTLKAHRYSKIAAERIEKAGGTMETLPILITGPRATIKKMRKSELAAYKAAQQA